MPKPTILICDDEEGVRESLKLILEDDYTVEVAIDGQEAFDKILNTNYDLVLLDIKMPRLDGLEVLECLERAQRFTKIIILSAYQSQEIAQKALGKGVFDYITKPFTSEEIRTLVTRALRA